MSDLKDIYLKELAEVKALINQRSKYWLAAFIIGFVLLLIILYTLFHASSNQRTDMLEAEQRKLDELTNQQKEIANQDRLRDSVLYETYRENSKKRDAELSNAKKKSNETIDRIYQPDFNADSIRRWWANN